MSLPTFRKISGIRDLADMQKVLADIDYNFQLIANQIPRLVIADPSAGTIKFLALNSDGDWEEWSLLVGAGLSLTQDDTAKTLTFDIPTTG